MSVRTRSEKNGLREFETFSDAMTHANWNEDVWKISFDLSSGERVRLVRQTILMGELGSGVLWVYELI